MFSFQKESTAPGDQFSSMYNVKEDLSASTYLETNTVELQWLEH